jgi:site-specific DNA recombinase
LFDESGQGLTPSHAIKKGRRYRYYISRHLTIGPADKNKTGWRLPAQEIEKAVTQAARGILSNRNIIATAIQDAGIDAHHIPAILGAADKISKETSNTGTIIEMVKRTYLQKDNICLKLSLASIIPTEIKLQNLFTVIQDIPMQMIARVYTWFNDLSSGKVASIAAL